MTGEEHYQLSEQLLALVSADDMERWVEVFATVTTTHSLSPGLSESTLATLAAARTHAELATAAMLADSVALLRHLRLLLTKHFEGG